MRVKLIQASFVSLSACVWLASAATTIDQATNAKLTAAYLKSPMVFEMNEGQSDPQVKALARGSRYGLFLTSNESVYDLAPGTKDETVVRVRTLGANPAPQVSGVDRMSSTSNYHVGQDKSKWRQNVAHYGGVKYASIYPGVDLIYYGNQGQVEYDYVVSPGADPNSIRLAIDGASKIRIARNGDLVLQTRHGALYHHKPVIYQEVEGVRREISGRFLLQENRVSFQVGEYDHSKDLVIDPSLVFLTYLGGSGTDIGKAITITTATGLTLVAGSTASANFPIAPVPPCPATPVCTTTGVTSYPYTGETDGFLATFSPSGGKLFNSTYIGGTGGVNVVTAIAIDNFEVPAIVYVAGYTTSTKFDVVNAAQPTSGGGTDAWVSGVLLNLTITSFNPPEGQINTTIAFATYLGGSGKDEILGIAMDQVTKDLFVTGFTTSTNFPVTAGALQTTFGGAADAFVTRYASGIAPETTPAGKVLFSTYYGQASTHVGNAIAVYTNPSTNAVTEYVAGTKTTSTGSQAFLVGINGAGTTNVFGEQIGSASKVTKGNAITTDISGNIYVAGNTNDPALPVVHPVHRQYAGGGNDAFVGVYKPTGGTAVMLTYWGGSGAEIAYGIGTCTFTAENGNSSCATAPGTNPTIDVFIAGYTTGKTFPILNAVQSTYGGGATDAFVSMFTNVEGAATWTEGYSTFLGGTGTDIIYGLAVGTSGNARVTGLTSSPGIATSAAYQKTLGGGEDAFAAQICTIVGTTCP